VDNRNPGTVQDVNLAYNQVWWDRGNRIVADRRTSLVVDRGRPVSAADAAAQKRRTKTARVGCREFGVVARLRRLQPLHHPLGAAAPLDRLQQQLRDRAGAGPGGHRAGAGARDADDSARQHAAPAADVRQCWAIRAVLLRSATPAHVVATDRAARSSVEVVVSTT